MHPPRVASGAGFKKQIGGVVRVRAWHKPGGPSQLAGLSEPDRWYFVPPEYKIDVPGQRVPRPIAHDRHETIEAEPAWQQALVFGQAQWAEDQAEFVLSTPDPPAEQHRRAESGCARARSEAGAVIVRQDEPAPDEAVHPDGRREER